MAEGDVELLDGSGSPSALTDSSRTSSYPALTRMTAGSVDTRARNSRSSSLREPAGGGTVADELEIMFRQNFSSQAAGEPMNPYQEVLSALQTRRDRGEHGHELGSTDGSSPRQVIMYEGSLPLLTQELVEMLSIKFGRLDCHHLGELNGKFYVKSLETDTAQSMFARNVPEENPINNLDDYRTLQMIDVWFSVHPLSTIVSKTMLMREYKSNTHDEILLAVILADASFVYGAQTTEQQSEALYQFAASQLRTRSVQNCNLSTAQALVLLGWHEICTFQARRGTCFIGYACRVINKLRAKMARSPNLRLSRINGVDVGIVESELTNNIYWITYSVTLWSFMQCDGPFADLVPSQLSAEFPPMDESSSAVAQLDIVSENVSTLQAQGRMIRELWQLSHIASTIGHMYALFPRETQTLEMPSVAWQAQPLHQLRQLFSPHQDISVLCIRIRRILADATEVLKAQVAAPSSQAYILTAYHTMIIHLLFPRSGSDQVTGPIEEEALDVLCTSARALIEIVAGLDMGPTPNPLKTGMPYTALANIITLALDACGRAMEDLLARCGLGSVDERQGIYLRKPELTYLAAELHKIAKGEKMSSARRLRIVKKKLKDVRQRLELCSGPMTPITSYDPTTPYYSPEDLNLYTPPLPGIHHRGSSFDAESASVYFQNYLSLKPGAFAAPEEEKEPLGLMMTSTPTEHSPVMMRMTAERPALIPQTTGAIGYNVMSSIPEGIAGISPTAGPINGMHMVSSMENFNHLHERRGTHPGVFNNA